MDDPTTNDYDRTISGAIPADITLANPGGYVSILDWRDLVELGVMPTRDPRAVVIAPPDPKDASAVEAFYVASQRVSYLPFADFAIYNDTYHNAEGYDGCYKCNYAGGFLNGEVQGDPPMTGYVEFFEPCDECFGADLCPGCLQPLTITFDASAFGMRETYITLYDWQPDASGIGGRHIAKLVAVYEDTYARVVNGGSLDQFTCAACGWSYDAERHIGDDSFYDDGGADDYPTFDADQLFH